MIKFLFSARSFTRFDILTFVTFAYQAGTGATWPVLIGIVVAWFVLLIIGETMEQNSHG